MSDDNDWVSNSKRAGEGFIKGTKAYNLHQGKNYKIRFNTSSACKVNVLDVTARAGKGDWIVRLDTPHKGAQFNHINLNPKYSGISPDPHIPLPTGALSVNHFLFLDNISFININNFNAGRTGYSKALSLYEQSQ